jgi:flagellar biosynthesis protein FlhA
MSSRFAALRPGADLIFVLLVLGILLLLFAPIPAALLDLLILTNFSLALLILLLTFYAPKPVEFSTFPAILLIATLFRLALNVSATRLILGSANAGHVIDAVGNIVVGGNYVIGLIVFLILVVVQYVVVTSGAQRVSEVAARFTLDSMPGQQMSIDADLNMGIIDQDEAKARRKNLEREAAFYGAMDGASKFVKGDAIAGIVIMLINIVGGLIVGVLQHGMSWADSLQRYTLLTIGDGIVTQIPALVVSVGTGLIVTRSGSDSELGSELLKQLFARPRTLVLVAITVGCVALLPGIPALPAVAISTLLMGSFFTLGKRGSETSASSEEAERDDEETSDRSLLPALEIRLGEGLAAFVGGEKGVFSQRVAAFRSQFANEMGVFSPPVKFSEAVGLPSAAYQICIQGDAIAAGEVFPHLVLAIHPTGNTSLVKGVETKDPSYGLPALWIEADAIESAKSARYTLVDPATVLFTHVAEVIRQNAALLLSRAETDKLMTRVRTASPGLVEELIPTLLSMSDVQKVLQFLVREKVPVRNLVAIVETLVDAARTTKDPAVLTEHVRQRLGISICNALSADRRTLHVITVDPGLERQLFGERASQDSETATAEPRAAENFLLRLAAQSEKMMKANLLPVVLCSPVARRRIRALCERATPHIRVLSVAEVPSHFELKAYATVGA